MKYDFKGYATKVNLKCSDGRVILKDAFKENDGATVPLVWQHMHNDPTNILGHAILENREDGVYAYCKFNDTPTGKNAKALVEHGDITALSIYANSLIQKGKDVVHGIIREVSLVLTGANPGAMIENVAIEHSDGSISTDEEEAIIYSGLGFDVEKEGIVHMSDGAALRDKLEDDKKLDTILTAIKNSQDKLEALEKIVKHADETDESKTVKEGKTVKEVIDSMTDEQKNFVYIYLLHEAYGEDVFDELATLADDTADINADEEDGASLDEIFNSMTDEQKNAVYILAENISSISHSDNEDNKDEDEDNENEDEDNEDDKDDETTATHNNIGGRKMKKNVFDNSVEDNNEVVRHSAEEIKTIFEDAKRLGSMKEACLAHSITNIEVLFPDAKSVGGMPEVIKRDDAWVPVIMGSTKHVPFAHIKSYAADLTADEARAKGYIKGNQKAEEIISVLKRTTNPTTIYKTQKLDRDDVLDITDFDIVAFIKNEMRERLNEEIARAILTGDGRPLGTDDKINTDCIRPIYKDVSPFTTRYTLDLGLPVMDLIDSIIRARKDYRGSGTPILFATTDIVTDMLLVKDTTGRRIFSTEAELASGLRVSSIVEVPIMEGVFRVDGTNKLDLKAILFNPRDYTIGSNAGGQVSFFDDFDIDYNKLKYLIETRISGCLVRPKAAIIFDQITDSSYSGPSSPWY
ncbi:MAG: phage major capsid protein [Endomicrobium sp.]|jgi:HK97 family phage prohead protease|uniref:phage major capsid protein n=1 Tax=Candidatus Endomicrobiellum cubanum TaxID=3242325 RepID=UPI002831FC6F|nr:phage major capsid protein [Endomicrobium sp.]